tara:strand:+ start:109935 stop:110405 length:471 start_codon:yes stop_codon:yes gene_type:complete
MPRNNLKSKKDITQALKRWLNYRQELIIQFNSLCHYRPFVQNAESAELKAILLTFCQDLIDYVSMGQFEIFALLMKQIEEISGGDLPSEVLIEELKQTTLAALEFSDKYATAPDLRTLDTDLSYLGEKIACRFDLEDDLVAYYPLNAEVTTKKKAG